MHFERFRAPDPAGNYALEPSRVLRLFRHHGLRPGDSRRTSCVRAQCERHAVADIASGDRAGGVRARWLREMLGLPADFKGVIADCASTASLLAIAAARDAVAPEIRARGMAGCAGMPKLRLYTSEQAHSSIEKGAMILGIGQENVRKIETDY